ncbi:unnamed protein product, partial [Acidithrix sp. C25]
VGILPFSRSHDLFLVFCLPMANQKIDSRVVFVVIENHPRAFY